MWPWLGLPMAALLRTSGFVDDVVFAYDGPAVA